MKENIPELHIPEVNVHRIKGFGKRHGELNININTFQLEKNIFYFLS